MLWLNRCVITGANTLLRITRNSPDLPALSVEIDDLLVQFKIMCHLIQRLHIQINKVCLHMEYAILCHSRANEHHIKETHKQNQRFNSKIYKYRSSRQIQNEGNRNSFHRNIPCNHRFGSLTGEILNHTRDLFFHTLLAESTS